MTGLLGSFWTKLIDLLNSRRRLPSPAPPAPSGPTSVAQAVVAEINAYRLARGLNMVLSDPRIDTVSQAWAANLATRDVLSHGDVAYRIASVYPDVPWGEDIATGRTPKEVVGLWSKDLAHAKIMAGDFNRVGVGIALSNVGWSYWVVDFAKVV